MLLLLLLLATTASSATLNWCNCYASTIAATAPAATAPAATTAVTVVVLFLANADNLIVFFINMSLF